MIFRESLKKQAKEKLDGHWADAVGIVLLFLIISIVTSVCGDLISKFLHLNELSNAILKEVMSLIITCLLTLGYTNFYLKIAREEDAEINDLWSKTNLFIPFIIVSLLVFGLSFGWSLLFIIPGIIVAISFSFVYYVMLDNPNMKPMEVLKESDRLMRGHMMDYILLNLSFAGWAFLGIFTLGILYFWLIPYISTTNAIFYNNIKELA